MELRNVYLCQSSLDPSYQHTVNFRNRDEQFNWFLKSKHKRVLSNTKSDAFRDRIVVKENIDNLLEYDYLILEGYPHHYYYFILSKSQETKATTLLTLELDVMQTYLPNLSYKFRQSFVERCHTYRWDETGQHMLTDMNIQDEGLEYGSMVVESKKTLYSTTGAYVICATSPLGELPKGGGSAEDNTGNIEIDTSNPDNGFGSAKDGKISNKFLRMIKGWEGFSSRPYHHTGDVPTIGYGTTKNYDPTGWTQLYPSCTEKSATIVLLNSVNTKYAKQVKNQMINDGIDLSKVKSNHFDAFTDLCYNGGLGAVTKSPMYKRFKDNINADPSYIAEGWENWWIKDGNGTVLQGLINRRKSEKNMFVNNVYEKRAIQNLSEGGYIQGDGYMPSASDDRGLKVVKSAEKLLGKPYRWGGNYSPLGNNDGTDCSGLCQWAYNDNGIKITRTTYTQIRDGKAVNDSKSCKPGDLLFMYPSSPGVYEHVVMFKSYNSDGTALCVEAQKTGTVIHHRSFKIDLTDGKMAIRRIL